MERHLLSASRCAKCFTTLSHLILTNPSEVSIVISLYGPGDWSSEAPWHPPVANKQVRGWERDPGTRAIAFYEQNPGMEISLFMLEFYSIFDGGKNSDDTQISLMLTKPNNRLCPRKRLWFTGAGRRPSRT